MTSNMPGGVFHEGNSVEGESLSQLQGTDKVKPGWEYVPAEQPEDMATNALGHKWGTGDVQEDRRSLRVGGGKAIQGVKPVWSPPGNLQRTLSSEGPMTRKPSGTPRSGPLEVGGGSLDRPVIGGDRQTGEPPKGSSGLDQPDEVGSDRPANLDRPEASGGDWSEPDPGRLGNPSGDRSDATQEGEAVDDEDGDGGEDGESNEEYEEEGSEEDDDEGEIPASDAITGDKDPYTQWAHCEHIVSTDNMLPKCAQWAHFDHIQNLPTHVAKMCAPNLFRICATTVATICPVVT